VANVRLGDGESAPRLMEASLRQLHLPLPQYGRRAGARQSIYFDPAETKIASAWKRCP
jgi:hypothetical protein